MNSRKTKHSIAVIGMGCTFPGAQSPEELWANVLAGRRFFRQMQPERLPRGDYYDADPRAPGRTYCDQMAVIEGWSFDPLAYRIPPVTVYATDVVHWLALDTARRAMRDAGLDLNAIPKPRTGVVLGNSLGGEFARSHYLRFRWPYVARALRRVLNESGADEAYIESVLAATQAEYEGPLPEINEDSLAGNMSNTIAGRICNHFDFGGGGYTVDGACSSSLLAVAKACDALLDGEMDVALVGGVDVSLDAFEIVGFAKTQALARDDIRPYDQHANGMLTGEGCGFFVLMREADAVRGGHRMRALIRGWGISSDGAGSMTAPEVEGQLRALRSTYRRAGYPISTVGLIEGHGTGTPLGDKVELTALRRLIEESPGRSVCRIGSIKASIGHCKAASGSAGLIKAIMALERKIMPPTLNCDAPHALLTDSKSRLRPSLHGAPWLRGTQPRRASVSGMGFGGANAHVTLEETNPNAVPRAGELALLRSYRRTEVVVVAGATIAELRERVERLQPIAARICRAELTDLAATCAAEEMRGDLRLAFVVESPWHLADALAATARVLVSGQDISACDDPLRGVFAGVALDQPQCVALFPGQGSQFLNMGVPFMRAYPFVEQFWTRVDKALAKQVPGGLRARIEHDVFADEAAREAWSTELEQTAVAQPAIVATSLAILAVLEHLGLKPTMTLGHSLGEITALQAAGACEPIEAVRMAAARGQAMAALHGTEPGGMVALRCAPEDVEPMIAQMAGYVAIANYNAPRQTVVSGETAALAALVKACEHRGIVCHRLHVSHAFHSKLVAPAADMFAKALKKSKLRATSLPMVSSITGGRIEDGEDMRLLLARQIASPVRFVEAVKTAAATRPALWVEVGAGGVLTGLVRGICGEETECLATHVLGEDALTLVHRVMARAFVLGFPVAPGKLFEQRHCQPFSMDYKPVFIVNPCERPVKTARVNVAAAPATLVAPAKPAAVGAAAGADAAVAMGESVMGFAIEWIAQRTGFPKTAIQPDMKLRDDLNLDSIKVGELVYNVSRKLNKQVPADPSAYANARLSNLIAVIQNDFKEMAADERSDVRGVTGAPPMPGLAEWVRTFQMEDVPAPLSAETFQRLPVLGSLCVVGDPACPRVRAFATRMTQHGLQTSVQDPATLSRTTPSPERLAMMVYFLPVQAGHVQTCSAQEFNTRMERTVMQLFRVFKWATLNADPSWANLRCVVARPYTMSADGDRTRLPVAFDEDLDAGRAFLKSLRLEHMAFQPKWLSLPDAWDAEQWATLVEKELQTSGRRVFYAYAPDATRYTKAAMPLALGENAPQLDAKDVVLCTGGAKGITFEMVRALAKKTGAAIALVGRSAAPAAGDTASELGRNLRALEQDGIRCRYESCDVMDMAALRRAVERVAATIGTITGILHGAGITVPRLFREMTEEQFLDTIRVKVHGLFNLLSVVTPSQLKMLHVITSVLGHTGMSGQTDYTLANAWLDGAVRQIQAAYPQMHCLTLGYSIWSETGIGRKLGAVDSLHAAGTTPIDTHAGVAAYLEVCAQRPGSPMLAITGRLNAEIDPYFYPPLPTASRRFLGKVLRYVPGTECITETAIGHDTDWYLSEHVFQGTPVLPGVMTIEAMTEVAQYCLGRTDRPSYENIIFERAVIVPLDSRVTLRIMTYAEPATDGVARVRAALYIDADGFQMPHLTAELVFGDRTPPPALAMPRIAGDIGRHPEEFSPDPLFQGKFFRRITAVRKMEFVKEVVTDVLMPDQERYYALDLPNGMAMPSPAARDAVLHSGILALPPRSLPASIRRLRVFAAAPPRSTVVCHGRVMGSNGNEEYISDLTVYDAATGAVIEMIEGVVTRVPQAGGTVSEPKPEPPVPLARVTDDLCGLASDVPLAFGFASYAEVGTAAELTDADRAAAVSSSAPRRPAHLAGLLAARRAAVDFARVHHRTVLDPHRVHLAHDGDGAPRLAILDEQAALRFADVAISLTDAAAHAAALIAPAPVGIDLEPVECRDAETWRALLHDDGYAQAMALARATHEPFDCAATRVWALLESSKKAHRLRRILPRHDAPRGGAWHSSSSMVDGSRVENLSVLVSDGPGVSRAALAVTLPCAHVTAAADSRAAMCEFEAVLEDFTQQMRLFTNRFVRDPFDADTSAHHAEVVTWIQATIDRLLAVQKAAEPSALYEMRQRLIARLREFIGDSEVVRHAIEKPYGYTGDFMMLEKLVQNKTNATGFGYHMDTLQLEYPSAQACRNRVKWVCDEVTAAMAERGDNTVRILDIGIGSAPVERQLLDQIPGLALDLIAVDIEPAALAFVEQQLRGRARDLRFQRIDLRREEAVGQLASCSAHVDACVAIGILEALRDEEIIRLVSTLRTSMPSGSLILLEAYLPTHAARPHMEWFMDFHLAYRSVDQVVVLLEAAGVDREHLTLPTEPSGSSGLYRITV